MEKSFIALIEQSIKKNWDLDALTHYKGVTLQYKDVARKIEKIHIILEESGVKPGDKIAVCGRNMSHCQRRAEKGTYTGRPADGKHQPEKERGKKSHVTAECIGLDPLKQRNTEYAEKIKTEKYNDRSGDDIDHGLIFFYKTAQAPGQST